MSWRTVVIENTCKVSYKNNYLIIQHQDIIKIHLSEINIVIFVNTQLNITGIILCELAKRKIKVIFCDEKYNPYGEIINYYGSHNTSKKVKLQTLWDESTKQTLWTFVVDRKIKNQSNLLRKLNLEAQADKLLEYAEGLEFGDITNREGHAAKVYFNALFDKGFTRDLASSINSALDYGYSIILSLTNREVVSNGCITQIGIYHCNEYNQFNLSCDLMEPFRVVVDEYVYQNRTKKFDKEYKYQLINLLNKKVMLNQEVFLSSAVATCVKSCIDSLNTRDFNKLVLYEFL